MQVVIVVGEASVGVLALEATAIVVVATVVRDRVHTYGGCRLAWMKMSRYTAAEILLPGRELAVIALRT